MQSNAPGNSEGWRSLVERTGLENRHTFTGIVGSNPTPSASKSRNALLSNALRLFHSAR